MSENIHYEAQLAILSVGTGIWLMIIYDFFRIVRMLIPHNMFWTGIEDFGYWIYCSVTTFDLLYRQNDGSLRAYVIVGTFLGMAGYQYLISRRLIKCLKKGQEYFRIKIRRRQQDSKQVKR
ncbi:MAG: spore cortex biosynthesis protein YabQ [Hungatella sp.]|nr:spore cortex biosynthesis protein YabQ [Hungatella sp.]